MNLYRGHKLVLHERGVKPVVTVWAEESGPVGGGFKFSYGDASNTAWTGYTMMCAGRILRMGLCGGDIRGNTSVAVVVNRVEKGKVDKVSTPDNIVPAAVAVFQPPVELNEGDIVNFKSLLERTRAHSTIVSLLIEVDLF